MSVKVLTFAAAFASIVVAAGQALSAEPTPVGLWQAVDDDTKQPTGWFLIRDHGGVYDGIIAKMILKPGEDPNEPCVQCKDDRHNHPWLGLENHPRHEAGGRKQVWERDDPRSARWQNL